jgi:hypothetical protein
MKRTTRLFFFVSVLVMVTAPVVTASAFDFSTWFSNLTSNTSTSTEKTSIIPEPPPPPPNTDSLIGDFAKLRADYFHAKLSENPTPGIVQEIAGIGITDFQYDGVVGVSSAGNQLHQYVMTVQFYIVARSALTIQDVAPITKASASVTWLAYREMDWISQFGTVKYQYDYKIKYDYWSYDAAAIAKKNLGGTFNQKLTCGFALPNSGESYNVGSNAYQIINVDSKVLTIQTGPAPAVAQELSSTTIQYVAASQSGRVETYDYSKFDRKNDWSSELTKKITDMKLGWQSNTNLSPESLRPAAAGGMSTNVRLSTGSAAELSGNYQYTLHAGVVKYSNKVNYRAATLYVDTVWPFQGDTATENEVATSVTRTVALGVQNMYVLQPIRVNIAVKTEIKKLEAVITPDPLISVTPPKMNDTVIIDDDLDGDTAIIDQEQNPIASWWDEYGGATIGIVIAIVAIAGIAYVMIATPAGPILMNRIRTARSTQ